MKVLLLVLERYSFHKSLWITKHLSELAPTLKTITVRTYAKVLPLIEKHKSNLYGVYFFQDLITDSYLFNFTIGEMLTYMKQLEDTGIKVFPNLQLTNWVSSKAYMADLPTKFNFPHTHTLILSPETDVMPQLTEILKTLPVPKIIIKKGYSYEAMSIAKLTMPISPTKLARLISKMDWIENYDETINMKHYEKGCDRIYIVQPWNRVITKHKKEYRLFFVDGKPMDFFSHGYGIEHTCLHEKEDMHSHHLKKLGQEVLDEFIKPFSPHLPAVVRIDMSYTKDPKLQDKYSVQTPTGLVRYGVNEIEIQPTFFFDLPMSCGSSTKLYQRLVFDALKKEIAA